MLPVKLVSLGAPLSLAAVRTLAVEMKHCITPVIEAVVNLLHVTPLLLRHELAMLIFVAYHRALDVNTRLTLTIQCTGVALLVELASGFQLVAAAALIQPRFIAKLDLTQ